MFSAAVTSLQVGSSFCIRDFCALRLITDPPLGIIPKFTPSLPDGIGVVENTLAPHGGEWFFPAAGPDTSSCLCCPQYPGDPQLLPNLGSPKRVVLYFHGGAFVLCSSKTHRALLMRIVSKTGAVVLAPDYRRPPENPWPAPVDDCLDCYKWLLEEAGQSPANIVFAGDSAGGGLVVAVLAAAKTAGLPLPSGGILWSPWVDLTDSFSGSWTSNQRTDFLPRDWAAKFASAYAGGDENLANASPCTQSLAGLPPLLIEVGDSECLHDQVVAFAEKAEEAGVDVELHVSVGMVHVFPLFLVVSEPDSPPRRAFERLSVFVDRVLGKHDAAQRGALYALHRQPSVSGRFARLVRRCCCRCVPSPLAAFGFIFSCLLLSLIMLSGDDAADETDEGGSRESKARVANYALLALGAGLVGVPWCVLSLLVMAGTLGGRAPTEIPESHSGNETDRKVVSVGAPVGVGELEAGANK